MDTVVTVRAARYDRIAAAYAARPDSYSVAGTASLLDLVGPVIGMRDLDLACGHGIMARELARRGGSVIGVDISSALVGEARAREAALPLGIEYINADAGSADLLLDDSFDRVVCNFGLSDIDELGAVLSNVYRLLRPDGTFSFCVLHPCFPGVKGVSASWSPVATYYDEGWRLADGELSIIRREVGANHRMVSTYLNMLIDAGLPIDRVDEPPPEESWMQGRPGSESFPVYLVVRVHKPA